MRDGEPLEIVRYLGTATNNIAEYQAAIIGLEHCVKLGASQVRLNADPELLVKQLNGPVQGEERGPQTALPGGKKLIAKIGRVEVKYIPGEMNREADALANKAIDEKL